jgi:hypothetical protein
VRLRRIVCALGGALSGALLYGTPALATDAPAPQLVSIERQGYAFEYPRVLAEQRLFGVAHGVSLLATACLDAPEQADAAAAAYARWYEQQQQQIAILKDELAAFYFGPHADEADWSHVADALKLRDRLGLAPDSTALKAACGSLPEALRQPRYDLTALFQLEAALAAMATAARAESHIAACAAQLTEAERPALNARYAEWQRREADAITSAQTQMLLYWQNTGTPGKPEDWLKAMKQRYAQPSAAACEKLPEWLGSSASSLSHSFIPAPIIAAPTEPEADNAVSAVSNTQPEAAPAEVIAEPAEPAADPIEAAVSNLFESLMRLFDERPHEDAALRSDKQPGNQPARSQRAHP